MTTRPFDHLNSFRFLVEIEGIESIAFASCDGLEISIDVIQVGDGNLKLPLSNKQPGLAHCHNIVLRRGLTRSSELWDWFRTAMEGRVERKVGAITILDENLEQVLRYRFHGGWPCRWKSLVLDASRSDVLIEELELAVERIERVQ
jgi:phage tail-like protein